MKANTGVQPGRAGQGHVEGWGRLALWEGFQGQALAPELSAGSLRGGRGASLPFSS